MWELLTRDQPYSGMRFTLHPVSNVPHVVTHLFSYSPATVAISVIRDNVRPKLPKEHSAPTEFIELIESCWNRDPAIRPTFLEIMTRLSNIIGEQKSNSSTGMDKLCYTISNFELI